MPTYQYTCTECGEPVEAVQKFTDAPLTVCAACGGRLRKVFSPVGIVFKGSGFYRTDSRNGTTAADAAAKDKPSGDSSGQGAPRANRPRTATGRGGQEARQKSGDGRRPPRPSRRPRARRSPDRSWRTWPGLAGRPLAACRRGGRLLRVPRRRRRGQDRHPVRGAERPGHGGRGGWPPGRVPAPARP